MPRAICPNCNTEFDIQNGSVHNCICGDTNDTTVIGTLVPATNNAKGEEKMAENGITMENIMTMMLNQQNQMNALLNKVVSNKTETTVAETVDGGKFGKNSQFYGKELCGYAWSGYIDARFSPKKFLGYMANSRELNVREQIKADVNLMDSVRFAIAECERLDYMSKKSKKDFDVRKHFYSVDTMRKIFLWYFDKVKFEIRDVKEEVIKMSRGKKIKYIKFHGSKYPAKIVWTTPNDMKPVKGVQIEWDLENNVKSTINKLESATTYGQLYAIMKAEKLLKLKYAFRKGYDRDTKTFKLVDSPYKYRHNTLCPEFIASYAFKGAFDTLLNLVKFKNFEIVNYKTEGVMKGREAVDFLMNKLPTWKGYRFYALLKDTVKRNNLNLAEYK